MNGCLSIFVQRMAAMTAPQPSPDSFTHDIQRDTFRVINKRHSERYPIIGARFPVEIERFACSLFGIIQRGAHLTAYTRTATGIKIWVPKRSSNLFTWPNCLDSTVAGGVAAGETPFDCVVREAYEEASLPKALVRQHARACGAISYTYEDDGRHSDIMGPV